MARKRRVVADDGLAQVTEIDMFALTKREQEQVFPSGSGGFEWRISDVERYWHAHAPVPRPGVKSKWPPKQLSVAWYARHILLNIGRVRAGLEQMDNRERSEAVIIAALKLGELIEDARWRFNLGEQTRLGIKVRATNRNNAKQPRPRYRPTQLKPRDTQIATDARALRKEHPYSPTHSTRWLALQIMRRHACSLSTVRRRLTNLGIR